MSALTKKWENIKSNRIGISKLSINDDIYRAIQ